MAKTVRFAVLEKLLLSLGFREGETPEAHKVFENSELDMLLFLPALGANDSVPPMHLVAVRRMLDEGGLMNRDSFDKSLEENQEDTAKVA